MRAGTPKMLDFLGLASYGAAKTDKTRQQTEGSQELANVAAKGIWVK
jgi:hypothetical protein